MVDAGRVLMHRLALGALWPVSGLCGDLLSARGINAPFGARCFMTAKLYGDESGQPTVLMRRLVLGALLLTTLRGHHVYFPQVLMHLMTLGSF